jgi:uncharacterized membrane protein
MPFCHQCGTQVGQADLYCGRCGSPQPMAAGMPPPPPRAAASPPPPVADPLRSVDGRTASILCYVPGIGWIMAIIVLAADRFRRDRMVRFHGFQGLYLFVAWMVEQQVVRPMLYEGMHPIHDLLRLVLLGASILMMVKAAHREEYSLPLLGDLAHKSMSED